MGPLCIRLLAVLFLVTGAASSTSAQNLYRYRDAQGNWVYSDRRPDAVPEVEQLLLAEPRTPPEIKVERRLAGDRIELIADNACFCPAEVKLWLFEPINVTGLANDSLHTVIAARQPTVLGALQPADSSRRMSFGYDYLVFLGEPGVKHAPTEPYRAPFAIARQFTVTQAYPARITHRKPSNFYAVDIAMPVGTQIYAARGGTVIEVASQFFEASEDPDTTQTNIIRVLHPDGTMSMYAHLNWDSIRVQPGQIIKRGEYIADSGNTGFTTGPHLHFAVVRNAGLMHESLPIEFAGPGGVAVTPVAGKPLVAY